MTRQHPHLDLIQTHLELALGSFLTALYRQPGWLGGYSADIDDHFWNFVLPLTEQPAIPLDDVLAFFDRQDRVPTLYGEQDWLAERLDELPVSGVEHRFTDSWMAYTGDTPSPAAGYDYVNATDEGAKEQFLDIFQQAFGKGGEDEPYGDLPDGYRDGVRRALDGAWGPSHNRNIIVQDSGDPVGIGTLAVKNGIAFIYNIATLPERQGEGIGTASTRKLTAAAQDHGVDRIILQTEADSYVEAFYERLGFEQQFTVEGWTGIDSS